MVSGNAMAHIYLDLHSRIRPYLPTMSERWQPLKQALLARESVDLMIIPVSRGVCEVHARGRGCATMNWAEWNDQLLTRDRRSTGSRPNRSNHRR